MATSPMGAKATTPQNGLLSPSNVIPKSSVDMTNPFNNGKVSANAPQSTFSPNKNAPPISQPAYSPYSASHSIGQMFSSAFNSSNPYGIQPSTTNNVPVNTVSKSSVTPTNQTGSTAQINKTLEGTGVAYNPNSASGTFTNTGSNSASSTNGTKISGGTQTGSSGTQTGNGTSSVKATGFKYDPNGNKVFVDASGNAVPDQNQGAIDVYGQGVYQTSAQNLSNTQPSTGATTAQTNLNNQATSTPANAATAQGLLGNFAQNQTPAVTEAYKNLQNFNQVSPLIASTQASIPMGAGISTGRGQILGNQLAAEEQGLANTYSAAVQGEGQQIGSAENLGSQALTGQQQQIGAATNAGNIANTAQGNQITGQAAAVGATQPVAGANYFGSPELGGTYGAGQGLIQTAVNNALQTGGDPATQRANLVSSYGALAGTAYDSAKLAQSNGTYNPTSASAASQQNATQGQEFQGQAAQVGLNVKTVTALQAPIMSLLQQTGMSSAGNSTLNSAINNYIKQYGNTGAAQSLSSYVQDFNSQLGQLIGQSGVNPTAIASGLGTIDIGNLPINQIPELFANVSNGGSIRQQQLTDAANSSYGPSGASVANTGNGESPSPMAVVGPGNTLEGSLTGTQEGQVAAGTADSVIRGAVNSVGNLGGEVIGWLAHLL